MYLALGIYSIYNFPLLAFLQRWQVVNDESPIIAALQILPAGVAALVVSVVMP
jgi:hypothetical protein